MGLIISRFRRKKTTSEILEKLESNIKRIEQDGAHKEQSHKRVVGYMMAYSVGLYVLFALLYYFMYVGKSQHWLHSMLYASPLLLLPVLVIFLRSAISWYFNWSLSKNRIKLNKMREEKKKILEEVMNTETYKVAKTILDKYGGNEESKALRTFVPTLNVPGNISTTPQATPGQLRQRQLALTSTPNDRIAKMNASVTSPALTFNGPRLSASQLARPLLDRNRSALEKVVDYLLKDGPNNRMALICSECCTHNGMAMEEEFEYVSYVCAYCGRMNPARKQRPAPPRLPPALLASNSSHTPHSAHSPHSPAVHAPRGDSSEVSSESDSDDEKIASVSRTISFNEEPDRPPSANEEAPKSSEDKKED